MRVHNKRSGNLPEGAVYVGRPTKYGNPFHMVKEEDRDEVIIQYIVWFMRQPEAWLAEVRNELRGKDLVCWCAPKPCHADFLLAFVNEGEDNA